MIISLEKQKREERYNLFLDGEFYSGLELETIVKYKLKNGQDISKERIDEILNESESSYAFNKALKYLSKSMKTENEVIDFLKSKKIRYDAIVLAIDKLKQYDYINDEIYINSYVNFYKSRYGKNKIKQNLIQKGLDRELVEENMDYDEKENLDFLVNEIKKQSKNQAIDLKMKQKIIRNLTYKGYNYDTIKSAFNSLGESDESWDWYNRNW